MNLAADTLPDDPGRLKAMLITERLQGERLEQIVKELQRHRFGRRAETLPEDQLLLALEEVEQGVAADEMGAPALKTERATRRRTHRGSLLAHPRRIGTFADIGDKACPFCRRAVHVAGEEVAERLNIVPAQFRALVTRRPRYGCRACESTVVQAPAPARLTYGSMLTEATVAHVLVFNYADHLPLYRHAQIYACQGVHPDRSTLADWVGWAAFLLRQVTSDCSDIERHRPSSLPVKLGRRCLIPAEGRRRPASASPLPGQPVMARGDRLHRLCLCARPQGRAAHRPSQGLCRILLVDRYGGYKVLAEKGDVPLAFCGAHVHRRLYELAAAGPAPIATEMLQRIAARYQFEIEIRVRPAGVRRLAFQDRIKPVLDALVPFLRQKLQLISRKTKLPEAIRYTLSRWEGFCRFTDNCRVEIDNDTIERSIRALMLETNDEWAVSRRYMTLETLGVVSDNPLVRLPVLAA
jgi:transposase